MDRDHEHSDRAARGRRIFEALRRGRPEDEPAEAAPPPEPPEPTTTTAVDESPAGAPSAEDDVVGEAATTPPVPTERESTPAPPAEPKASSPVEGGNGSPVNQGSAPHAPEEAEPTAEPPTAEPPTAEPPTDEPPTDEPPTDDGLPGVDTLRAHLAPPEAPGGPETDAGTTGAESAPPPAEEASVDERPVDVPLPPDEQADGVEAAALEPAPSDAFPRVIAIANQKGGVGKTTTAVNLGAALSELGYRVLVVDLDPQGNATTGLGIDIRNLDGSVYESLMGDTPLEDCIEATSVRNLFVAPSNMELAGAEIELVPVFSRELKLRRAIEGVKADYDFVLIDCPPSLGLLTVNGLAAADDVIVPIQCEYYALEGLGQLVNNVNLVRSNLNPVLDIRGIVLTMYDARTKLADQVVQEVRSHFGGSAYETVVPRTVRLSEAPSYGQPIIVFDNASRGSQAYRALAQEVAERVAGRPRDPITVENDRDD